MEEKEFRIDEDLISRNWLLLARLAQMGYDREEAILLAEKIESGEICLKIW